MSPISVSPSGPPDGIAPTAATPRSSRPRRTNQSDTQKSAHYRRERRVYALVAALPYSGAPTAFFSFDMTIESFLEGHARA
jgi:hypothetical protein